MAPTSVPTMTSSKTPRFHFLDALRGVAAVSVVLHHLFFASVMTTIYEPVSPELVRFLFRAGANGVEIFFVLSGFVIAHSLRNNSLSPKDLGRFIVRRQVRLDPPYWAALAIGMIWLWVRNYLPGVERSPLPSPSDIVLNATYLQNIFYLPKEGIVLDVAWTLCLEIQFYLLFIAVLWLCHDTRPPQKSYEEEIGPPPLTKRTIVIMWASGALCLLTRHFVVDPHAIYFWTAWHYFVAGVLAYWAVTRKTSNLWIATFLGAFALSWVIGQIPAFSSPLHGTFSNCASPVALFVGAATALSLWQLGIRDKLSLWENARPLQYLGRIS